MYLHIVDFIEKNGCIAKSEIVSNSYHEIAIKASENNYALKVNTKYKTIDKKVKPVAMNLPMVVLKRKRMLHLSQHCGILRILVISLQMLL